MLQEGQRHRARTRHVGGVQREDGVGVARQRGGAGQRLRVEQAQDGRVGGQRQVAGQPAGRPDQAQVGHLVQVADQLPG